MTAAVTGRGSGRRMIARTARLLLLAVVVALIAAGFVSGFLPARKWQPFLEPSSWAFFARGLLVTLYMGVMALVLSVLIGIPFGIARADLRGPLRVVVSTWIELVRATPVLAILIIVFLGLGRVGIDLDVTTATIVGLVIYNSAVLGEIVRAGILSIPRGEVEAARSLGLGYFRTMRHVVLPQALGRMMPAIVSQLITLIKDTSLAFIVGGAAELVSSGRSFFTFYGNLIETYIVIALLFFAINYPLSRLARRLETRRPADQRVAVAGEEDQLATVVSAPAPVLERPVSPAAR